MDDLNMDSLDLPETGNNYDDLPDASDALEEKPDEPVVADITDDMEGIEMPTFSEMDGTSIEPPINSGSSAAPLNIPPEASDDWHKHTEAKPVKPAFEEMDGAAPAPAAPAEPPKKRYDYSNMGQGTYSHEQQRTTGAGTMGSMDDFFAERDKIDPVKFEKGKERVHLICTIALVVYILGDLSDFGSLFKYGGFINLLTVALDLAQIYLIVMFYRGSGWARNILGYITVANLVFGFIGIGSSFASIGLLGFVGLVLFITQIGSVLFNIFMAYLLFADENIAEYAKGSNIK